MYTYEIVRKKDEIFVYSCYEDEVLGKMRDVVAHVSKDATLAKLAYEFFCVLSDTNNSAVIMREE